MPVSYANWPTTTEVSSYISGSGLTLNVGMTTDMIQNAIDAAVEELSRRTGRTLKPVTETRYFDGSGTGLLDVEEYVDVTAIQFFSVPALGVVTLTQWHEVERKPFPKSQIQILQGPPNVPYGYYSFFPQGRSNIGVTAIWGYSSAIPALAWNAVRARAAGILVNSSRINATIGGVIHSIKDEDQDITFSETLPSKLLGWDDLFESAVARLKRPLRDFMRRNKPTLI